LPQNESPSIVGTLLARVRGGAGARWLFLDNAIPILIYDHLRQKYAPVHVFHPARRNGYMKYKHWLFVGITCLHPFSQRHFRRRLQSLSPLHRENAIRSERDVLLAFLVKASTVPESIESMEARFRINGCTLPPTNSCMVGNLTSALAHAQ